VVAEVGIGAKKTRRRGEEGRWVGPTDCWPLLLANPFPVAAPGLAHQRSPPVIQRKLLLYLATGQPKAGGQAERVGYGWMIGYSRCHAGPM